MYAGWGDPVERLGTLKIAENSAGWKGARRVWVVDKLVYDHSFLKK